MSACILRSIAVAEIIFIACCCCCCCCTSASGFGLLSSTTSSVQLNRNHHQDLSVLRLSSATTPDATTTTTATTSITIDDYSIPKISNEINDTIQDLLRMARELGPVGVRSSAEDQQRINDTVSILKDQLQSARKNDDNDSNEVMMKIRNDFNYTSVPLIGKHDLIYSAAPGSSSGKIGPLYGMVTQTFVNTTTFRNAVEFGSVLRIALTANRHVKDETTFIVTFDSIQVSLLGMTLMEKSIRSTGGVWNIIYTGIVYDTNSKKKILLRIMETPSLFIIEQNI